MAEDKDGGLMYQQLRKFINVIVSIFLAFKLIYLIFHRTSCAMSGYNNSSSCPGFAYSARNLLVKVQCLSRSSDSTSCLEETVS